MNTKKLREILQEAFLNNRIYIAIPTYNRSESLHRTLLFLSKSLEGLDNIYINVIDNCSTDNTKNILTLMEDYFGRGSLNFSYHINSKNLGYDASILYIAQNMLSSSAFTWFLADDDYLISDGVRLFVEKLSMSNKKMELAHFSTTLDKDVENDPLFRTSFLSSVALKSEFNPSAGIEKLIGTNYIHLAVINTIVKERSEFGISEFKVGIQMPNISSRFAFFKTLILGYSKCLMFNNDIMTKKDALREAVKRAESNSAWALLDYAIDGKLVDWDPSLNDVQDIVGEFGLRSYKILLIIFAMKVPRLFLKLLLKRKINQYLKDMANKKKIIKKYI